MPLSGLGVILIHLHFLQSAIYPCSQHRQPVVFVFLLRVSINKILWLTLVPLSPCVYARIYMSMCRLWLFVGLFLFVLCVSPRCHLLTKLPTGRISLFSWCLFLVRLSCKRVVRLHRVCHRQ